MLGHDISYYIMVIPAILIALMVHEVAHGYAAYWMGDNTAKMQGRLSFNPIQHIDPVGFLCLVIAGFGWAKPVQVNINNFKNKKVGMAVTALAGPMSNFILAFICALIYLSIFSFPTNSRLLMSFAQFAMVTGSISIGLGIFNLIPVPPLDGSNIILPFLSNKIRAFVYHNGQIIQFVLLALLIFNFLDPILIMGRSIVMNTIDAMAGSIIQLFM